MENEQIVADVQSVVVNSEIQQVVQVEASEPSLTLFGGEISPQPVVQDQTQDVFFLAPESDREIADTSVAVENAVQEHTQTVQQDHSQHESTQTQVTTTHLVQSSHHQTPQEILSLQPQILEGEWTVDKWEYWFRNSSLSPAVQELAQHGLMIGTINGQSTFQTSKQYENLLNQTQHDLEASLKQQWSSTVFNVQYGEVETITPFMMQRERKVRAFDRASEMLHQEPIVKSLMEAFDGQLENIQLK